MKQLIKAGGGSIQLMAGLGNPGERYEDTYHNVGFMALAWLLENSLETVPKFKPIGAKFEYAKSAGRVWVKPLVFMNESGLAIAEAGRYFNIPPERMAVIHDESDLALGEFKFSTGSGSAGHHGAQSIIDALGTNNFLRIRIGIRAREATRRKAGEIVLGRIPDADYDALDRVFRKIAERFKKGGF